MQEDLAAMGHTPDDDEFYAIILGSLPSSFEPFISALNATSSVLGTVLSPDELIQAFTDEYERRNIGKSSKREEENAAFSTEEGNGRKGNNRKGKCYNCGKPGHRKDNCWEEGGGKEDQKPNWLKEKEKWQKEREGSKEKEKPKAAATSAITEDAAWMAHFSDSDSDDNGNTMSSTNVTLNDLLEVDEELRKEMNKCRREYYSVSSTGNMATHEIPTGRKLDLSNLQPRSTWVHKMNGSEESQGHWDEQVERESIEINEQVDNEGNQPIPQPAEPKTEEVGWTTNDSPATEAERQLEIETVGKPTMPQTERNDPKGLPLAQPEEQGEYEDKAANGETGEDVVEVDWGIATVDERPKEADMKVELTREYYPGAAWDFQNIGRLLR